MNLDQAIGSFLGLAIGDALGCTLEFTKRKPEDKMHTEIIGGGPFAVAPGSYTDDTCMAMAMATSLLKEKSFNAISIMQEFVFWYRDGKYSPSGQCDDIGATTSQALRQWETSQSYPYSGRTEEDTSGNGGVMRLAPIIIWHRHIYENAMVDAVRQSLLTHASENCVRYAQALASILWNGSTDPKKVYGMEMCALAPSDNWPHAGGDVMSATKAAVWAVNGSSTFEEAVLKAVNLGGDSDTVGAIAGQIAGRIYGASSFPKRWLKALINEKEIRNLAIQLFKNSPTT